MPEKIKILTFNLLVYKNLSTTDKSIVDKLNSLKTELFKLHCNWDTKV